MTFQNYIIKKGLKEIFGRDENEYMEFITYWGIVPQGDDRSPIKVMKVVAFSGYVFNIKLVIDSGRICFLGFFQKISLDI